MCEQREEEGSQYAALRGACGKCLSGGCVGAHPHYLWVVCKEAVRFLVKIILNAKLKFTQSIHNSFLVVDWRIVATASA